MRKLHNLLLVVVLLAVSCIKEQDVLNNPAQQSRSQSADAMTYYWYKGEKVPLLVKDDLTKDGDIGSVYPSYQAVEGTERVGTSDVFYLKLKDVSGIEAMEMTAESKGVTVVKEVPYMPLWYILSIKDSDFASSIDASNYFYETGLFADVDPAFLLNYTTMSVNDPYYSDQWGLKNLQNPGYDINVEDAWAITKGAGVKVAVVDSGIDYTHADLDGNVYPLHYNTVTQTTTPYYDNGNESHGTHVAGIIAAEGNNDILVTGVAYEAELINVYNPLDTHVSPDIVDPSDPLAEFKIRAFRSAELASGITWAWGVGADVINCSWGVDLVKNGLNVFTSTILEDAIVNALTRGRNSKGCIVVFASGNDTYMSYPANFDSRILTVGAIDRNGCLMNGSGYSSALDVVAPGVDVISTYRGNDYRIYSGTSQAAPHVSGIAALVIAANPNLSREEVVRAIELSCRKIPQSEIYNYNSVYNRYNGLWHNKYGYGLPDAGAAVQYAWNSDRDLPSGGYSIVLSWENGSLGGQNSSTITLNGNSRDALLYLMPNVPTGSDYKYFWQVEDNAFSAWKPSFTEVYGSGAMLHIPANPNQPPADPDLTLALRISCGIYDGTTLIGSPVYTIYINP